MKKIGAICPICPISRYKSWTRMERLTPHGKAFSEVTNEVLEHPAPRRARDETHQSHRGHKLRYLSPSPAVKR